MTRLKRLHFNISDRMTPTTDVIGITMAIWYMRV